MCYHFSLNADKLQLKNRFDASTEAIPELPLFHIAGHSLPLLPIITEDKPNEFQMYQWGLIPHWSQDLPFAIDIQRKTFNARSESIFEKPSFRESIVSRRCLIPATGFFEWKDVNGKKYPHFISLKDNSIFSFAGIYDQWTDGENSYQTFSIITTEANHLMAEIHNTKKRMPLILEQKDENKWLNKDLDQASIKGLFELYDANKMSAHTISRLISNKDHNSNVKEVLNPFTYQELAFEQGKLF